LNFTAPGLKMLLTLNGTSSLVRIGFLLYLHIFN